ncbi:MAG TPA: DUF4129 domain-containing protein [Bacillota bacterium]|nr:DUF4129 domain-containing protein [Bacillota bacterium]
MRDRVSYLDYLVKAWMDIWVSFPIVLAIGLIVHEGLHLKLFIGLLVFSYIIGFLTRCLTRQDRRYKAIIICTLFSLLAGYVLGKTADSSMIIFIIYNFIASFRGMIVAERDEVSRDESIVYNLATLLVYFMAYLVYKFTPSLVDHQNLITYMGLIATVSTLFIVNRDVLIRASRSSVGNYRSLITVKRNNRIVSTIILLVILAIANYSLIKSGMGQAIRGIMGGFVFLIRFILSLGPTGRGTEDLPPPAQQSPHIPPANEGKDILGFIITILIMIALLAFTILLIRFIVKQAIKYIPRLYRRIKNFLIGEDKRSSRGYSDEKESLVDWQLMLKNSLGNIKDLFGGNKAHMPKWKDMKSNRQRVKYIYRFIVQGAINDGHYIRPGKTPKETSQYLSSKDLIDQEFAGRLADLYGKARYSDDEIGDKETDQLLVQSGLDK